MEQLTELLSHIKMFVLDMDGTIYLGEHLFPFTKRFQPSDEEAEGNTAFYQQQLQNRGIPEKAFPHGELKFLEDKMLLSNGESS